MNKNALFYVFTLYLISLMFVSCDDNNEEEIPDGNWPGMKWKVENIIGDIKFEESQDWLMNITISGEGSLDLICSNYSSFWIGEVNYPENKDWLEYDYEWLKINISGDTAHCEFSDVPEKFHNELIIILTAGDIFYTVVFNREENFGSSGKWSPIQWSLENVEGDIEMENQTYHTNFFVEGNCTFDLVCTNYEDIWFLPSLYTPWPLEDIYNVDSLWCHLSIKGNTITCRLDAWDGDVNNSPGIDFEVTAGEINTKLYFYQKSVIHRH